MIGEELNTGEPVGTVIEIKERHGHTFAERKSRVVQWAKEIDVGTLLYTHPVKELTNDEMRKVINEIVDGVTVSEMVTFLTISKAILRKAQEK